MYTFIIIFRRNPSSGFRDQTMPQTNMLWTPRQKSTKQRQILNYKCLHFYHRTCYSVGSQQKSAQRYNWLHVHPSDGQHACDQCIFYACSYSRARFQPRGRNTMHRQMCDFCLLAVLRFASIVPQNAYRLGEKPLPVSIPVPLNSAWKLILGSLSESGRYMSSLVKIRHQRLHIKNYIFVWANLGRSRCERKMYRKIKLTVYVKDIFP
jgi:hypothetical protein